MTQCAAKSKTSGNQCKLSAVEGKKVCRLHGGLTPSGMASVHFKHGRYSKHLPSRIAGRFEEAMKDTDLLNLTAEIALVDARMEDLLSRVESGETNRLWLDVKKVNFELREAFRLQNGRGISAAIAELGALVTKGATDSESWTELFQLVTLRKSLAESERKRRLDMQMMISADSAMIFVAGLLDILRRNIRDPKLLAAIADDIARLDAGLPQSGIEPGS